MSLTETFIWKEEKNHAPNSGEIFYDLPLDSIRCAVIDGRSRMHNHRQSMLATDNCSM